jgi:geranylgeranyl pyrophosphate synthase
MPTVSPWPAAPTPTDFSRWVDAHLEGFLAASLDQALEEAPDNLSEAIRYSLLAPGKRIRPRLALACGALLELPPTAALAAGCAIEMVHCFTLIHDDLPCMDDDDFRRGRPSNHKAFGEGLALLAGDALIALRRLSWASGPRGVIGGQAMEPLLTQQPTLEGLERMFALKTGALFSTSLLLPLDLAGMDEDGREGVAISNFARELGYAFQVADDLEDAEVPGSTEHEKPHSIVYHLSASEAARRAHSRLSQATDDLRTLWGPRATLLVGIGGEVLTKLDVRA